jgi:hypothetical protein
MGIGAVGLLGVGLGLDGTGVPAAEVWLTILWTLEKYLLKRVGKGKIVIVERESNN